MRLISVVLLLASVSFCGCGLGNNVHPEIVHPAAMAELHCPDESQIVTGRATTLGSPDRGVLHVRTRCSTASAAHSFDCAWVAGYWSCRLRD